MPSFEHNGLVELFRENPSLAPHLVDVALHAEVPAYNSAAVVEATVDQLIPAEFRADLVVEMRDAGEKLVGAIILEVQLAEDPTKPFSWPVYVAGLRARKRCPVCVLVVAPEARVAAWARRSIDLGFGRGSMQPFVLGPAEVPAITDPEAAEREPELAILSARAHGNDPNGLDVVIAALSGLVRFDQELADVYLRIIYDALREPVRRALEAFVMDQRTQEQLPRPPFVDKLIALGETRGEAKGEARGKRDALLKLLARTSVALTDEERARIEACDDLATLDRWFDRAIGARSASELFA